jgi:hypothetical protein
VKRKTVCIYVDAELVEEAAKAAEERGTSLSSLVEEALRLYVAYVLRRPPEPRARRAKRVNRKPQAEGAPREAASAGGSSLHTYDASQSSPHAPAASPQLPPHLQNNAWVAVLRSRR